MSDKNWHRLEGELRQSWMQYARENYPSKAGFVPRTYSEECHLRRNSLSSYWIRIFEERHLHACQLIYPRLCGNYSQGWRSCQSS